MHQFCHQARENAYEVISEKQDKNCLYKEPLKIYKIHEFAEVRSRVRGSAHMTSSQDPLWPGV